MRKRLTVNALLLLGSDGGSRLLTLIANVYIARTLGPANFGVVFLGLTVLSYALQSGDFGLATLGTREMAKPDSEREFSSGDIHSLRTLLGIAAAVIAAIVVFFVIDEPIKQQVSWIFLLAVLPSFWQLEWYYQGVQRYGVVAVIRYLFGLSYLAGSWILVNSSEDVVSVPAVYLGALVVASTVAVLMRRNRDRLLPSRSLFGPEQKRRWWAALKRSTPIGFGGSAAQIIQLFPAIIIAILYSDAAVGEFGAAFRLAINLMIFDRAFIALFLPAVSRLLAQKSERAPQFIRRTFRQILFGGVVLALSVTILSGQIVTLVYNDLYAQAALPLAIMTWYIVATLINSFFSSILLAAGIEKSYLHSSLVSMAIGGVLIVVFTWQYGITGAAIAMTASEVIMATLMYFKYRKHVGIKLRES